MKSLIYKMKQEIVFAIITIVVGIGILFGAERAIALHTALQYPIEIWIDGCKTLDFFFPLLVTLPFTWRLYYERKDRFLTYVSVRTDERKYVAQRVVSGMIVVFFMIFIIYFVGLILGLYFLKPKEVVSDNVLYRYLWGHLQAELPLLFGFVWCAWKSMIGVILCGFGYGIAMLSDNLFVIVLFPFLYCTIENFVTGTLGLEEYSICTTYILNRLSPRTMKPFHYYVGIIVFILVAGILFSFWAYKKAGERE